MQLQHKSPNVISSEKSGALAVEDQNVALSGLSSDGDRARGSPAEAQSSLPPEGTGQATLLHRPIGGELRDSSSPRMGQRTLGVFVDQDGFSIEKFRDTIARRIMSLHPLIFIRGTEPHPVDSDVLQQELSQAGIEFSDGVGCQQESIQLLRQIFTQQGRRVLYQAVAEELNELRHKGSPACSGIILVRSQLRPSQKKGMI